MCLLSCQVTFTIVLLASFVIADNIQKIQVFCAVQKDIIVEVDPVLHRYFPYVVKLPRCAGSVGVYRPDVKKCVAESSVSSSYIVYSVKLGYSREAVSLASHTKCKHACVGTADSCNTKFQTWNEGTCQCNCKYSSVPEPSPCEYGKVWQKSTCNCVCSKQLKCPDNKEWNSDVCACTCKKRYINRCLRKNKVVGQDCRCIDPVLYVNSTQAARGSEKECGGVPNNIIVMIIIIEFLGLLFIFFLMYRCCLRHIPDPDVDTLPRRMVYEMKTIGDTLQRIAVRKKKETDVVQQNGKELNFTAEPSGCEIPLRPTEESFPYAISKPVEPKVSQADNHEAPVGFYYHADDDFGSHGNISVQSTGQVTEV